MSDFFKIQLSDKKEDITSFSSLKEYKRIYKGEKIGHAGTLDKFASGLMVVLIGGATKLNPIFSSFDKRYTAKVKFGLETDTLDREGDVIKTSLKIPSREEIERVLPSFLGKQEQVPPLYSAIHVDGKRAYKEAKKNRDIVMPARDIEIKSISLLSLSGDEAVIDVRVSKGTYIRSLARDLASSLGSCGHLIALRRTEVGPFTLDDLSLDTSTLLEKTMLFGSLYFPEEHRSQIENGTIKREWMEKGEKTERPYSYLYIGDKLYGYCENGERIKVMARAI